MLRLLVGLRLAYEETLVSRWKLRWPWERVDDPPEQVQPILSKLGSLQDMKVEWEEVPKTDPPSAEIGRCIFCTRSILQMEDHLRVNRLAEAPMYGDILSCEDCARKQGLKW
jgi:hypothetical protein